MRRIIPLIALALAALTAFALPASAQQSSFGYTTGNTEKSLSTFPFPTVEGVAVDHCVTSGNNCGQGGADFLCKMKGFDAASTWKTYKPGQTYILGSKRYCTDQDCTGFSTISCVAEKKAPKQAPKKVADQKQAFQFPTFRGVIVDHCERSGRNCGRGGADALCKMKGFDKALDWKVYKPGQTYILGSERLCTDPNCTGFSAVTCGTTRHAAVNPAPYTPEPYHAPEAKETFKFPKVQGVVVDHCARFGRNCGKGGADLLCNIRGYDRATDWQTYTVGKTYVIGSKAVCDAPNCTGLSSVSCAGLHQVKKTGSATKKKSTSLGGGLGVILPLLLNPNSQPSSPFFNDGSRRDDRRIFGNDGRIFDNNRRDFGNSQRGFNNGGFARTGEIRRFAFPQFNGISIDTCAGRGTDCKRGGANLFCRSKGFAEAIRWNTYRAGSTWYTGTNRQCRSGRCVGVTDLVCGN